MGFFQTRERNVGSIKDMTATTAQSFLAAIPGVSHHNKIPRSVPDMANNTQHMDCPCLICNKPRGDHRAKTFNCPAGEYTRIGWISFHETNVFKPDPSWIPPVKPFVI